ncbi:MAG TPA: D-aminoacylase [Blastocatellia bacterium]|nr:D-aminoacylase [Blastocatellia bacterium]
MKTPDLILKNGTVVDGTGRMGYDADIAIRRNYILGIDVPGTYFAAEEIDCSGLVIAPGFIDTHSHSDLRVLTEPQLPMKVRQGITLEVFGQDGVSVAPIRASDQPQVARSLAGLDGQLGRAWDWESVAEYLAAIEKARPAIDCAYLIPHGAVRLGVMGMEDRRARPDEIRAMQEIIRQSMREGAFGLSTGLIYPPCCFADTAELVELCRAVAEFDGVFVSHMRSESDYIEDAVAEMIEVGIRSGARVHISHFKVAGRENWSRIDGVLELIHRAQSEGARLTADQYPYIAGSTMLGAILPPWAHAGGVEATLERLASADERARMSAAMLDRSRSSWDNFWKWSGPEGIVVSDIASGNPERVANYLGRNLAEAARLSRRVDRVSEEEAAEFAFDLLLAERMGVGMISFSQSEDVVRKIMLEPYVNVCTDGLLGGKPHPRAYGTYPRMLGRYVREQGLLTIEEAVRKMSGLAAETFRLHGYGRIEEAMRANLVVFDPRQVVDLATFDDSKQYPLGVEYVIVGGELTVRGEIQMESGNGIAVKSTWT